MARTNELKKHKLIWTLIILLGAMAVFAYIILYNGGMALKETNSIEVVTKLKVIQVKGGEFELNQKDMDELSTLYFSKPLNKGDITVQGVNTEMLNDKITIEAPIIYNKLHLLLTSTGKLNFSNGKVTYVADNFKIGKLPLPKNLVISQISKLNNKNFDVEDNLIKINPSVFPFKITSFKTNDSKILGVAEAQDIKMSFAELDKASMEAVDKQLAEVKQKIQSVTSFMNEAEKAKANEILNTIENVKGKSIEEKKKVISDTLIMIDKAKNKVLNK